MTYKEVWDKILASNPDDWNLIVCGGYGSGPSYRSRFTFSEVREGARFVLDEESHSMVAVYKPDVSVTMAWGLWHERDFKEPWANGFPDPHASSVYVDIFYNGSLVDRKLFVTVDGGRAYLPLPESRDKLIVPLNYSYFIRLIDQMSRRTQYTDYLRRAGIKTVDEEWPR